MIDEENWDRESDSIVRTKWFNKYGQMYVSRQAMFQMLQNRTHKKSRKDVKENEYDSNSE